MYLCNMRRATLFILLFLSAALHAQQQTFRGRVVDAETGEPLPYATIRIKKGESTMANREGNFAIKATRDDVLQFSAAGYSAECITANKLLQTVPLKPYTAKAKTKDTKAEDILKEVADRFAKEYQKHANAKNQYFVRQTASVGDWKEMTEMLQVSESALNIGTTTILHRRQLRNDDKEGTRVKLPYYDLMHLMELGPTTSETTFWRYLAKPIFMKSMAKPTRPADEQPGLSFRALFTMRAFVDTRSFEYSCETLQDAGGNIIYKIQAKRKPDFAEDFKVNLDSINDVIIRKGDSVAIGRIKNHKAMKSLMQVAKEKHGTKIFVVDGNLKVRDKYGTEVNWRDAQEPDAFPIIEGTIYVLAKNFQLLAFDGVLDNFALIVGRNDSFQKQMADVTFHATYSHQRGFTEVESMACHTKTEALECNIVLKKQDGKKVGKKAMRKARKNLPKNETTDSVWQENYILPTAEETALTE